MNFFEEALIQFEELEELFNHIWTEKNFSWFGTLIDPGPEDDTLPLLSVSKKPYRDLILASNISVFDLRTYLLTRQCELLAKLGRIGQIAVNTSSFLARFGQRLRAAAVGHVSTREMCFDSPYTIQGHTTIVFRWIVDLLILPKRCPAIWRLVPSLTWRQQTKSAIR